MKDQIESDASTREQIGGIASGHSGHEEQMHEGVVVGVLGFMFGDDAAFDCAFANGWGVDTSAVIFNANDEVRAAGFGGKNDASCFRFARSKTQFSGLNSVSDGVSSELNERIGESVGNATVDGCLFSSDRYGYLPIGMTNHRFDSVANRIENVRHCCSANGAEFGLGAGDIALGPTVLHAGG
jgi:hypothetical protein